MRVVVALGGNALLERGERPDASIQRQHVQRAAQALAPIASEHELIICHGNGPQVGVLALESAADTSLSRPYPLDVLVAQTQGMIGYWLAQELRDAGVTKPVAALVTQTVVDAHDSAFAKPTKPVGPIYDEQTARCVASEHRWTVAPDGANWRRVVPSPLPLDVVELRLVAPLLEGGAVVVIGGGGGAPVVSADDQLIGVEAVVDKDLVAALLARRLKADRLLILTDVAAVIRDYGTDHATPIHEISASDLAAMNFASGSMGPKVEAAAGFVAGTGRHAAIGALKDAVDVLEGRVGTQIFAG